MNHTILVKIISILFLGVALLRMPYGYYQLVHWVVTAGCAYMAYSEYSTGVKMITPIYIVGIIVFNPLFKIPFKRTEWQLVDKIAIIVLFLLLCFDLYRLIRFRSRY